MDWIIAGMMVAVGAALALSRSSYMVDYVLVVYVFNRGLRRLLDWYAGAFNPYSPLSVASLVVAGLMLLPLLPRMGALPKSSKTILYCFLIAIGYAFIIGFVRVAFAAVYSLAETLAPIAVFGYILVLGADQKTKDRWLRTAAWCAILASAYGWYQYLTIPPWDAFWVREVGFEGYLGLLEPMKLAVFSTMAERGVLGGFLGFAVVPMILASKWRPLSWLGVILVLSVILLAQTRTGLIVAAFSTIMYVMINRGTALWQLALGLIVVSAAGYFGIGLIPGSEKLQERFATIGSIQETGSFEGRVEIYQTSLSAVLTNPLGSGLGATGLSGRINVGGTETQSVVGDAGYIELAIQFGWFGTLLILYALWRMWQDMSKRYRIGFRPTELMLARAFMLALIPSCFVSNVVTQFSILWIVFGAALDPQGLRVFAAKLQIMRSAASRPTVESTGSPG
jgi:putative inorganic carbon (hco3(-)) transporter